MIGAIEILIILIVIGIILLFGAGKVSELAHGIGKAKGEYEKGKLEAEKEIKKLKKELKSDGSEKEKKRG